MIERSISSTSIYFIFTNEKDYKSTHTILPFTFLTNSLPLQSTGGVQVIPFITRDLASSVYDLEDASAMYTVPIWSRIINFLSESNNECTLTGAFHISLPVVISMHRSVVPPILPSDPKMKLPDKTKNLFWSD